MITGVHCFIRTAEPDDAQELKRLYDPAFPRAGLMDRKRELTVPTLDELREVLGRKETKSAAFCAIEDLAGTIRGFCSLRSAFTGVFLAELVIMLFDEADYVSPLADEVFEHLRKSAFVEQRLRKVVSHAFPHEAAFREFLCRHGFESNGRQRDIYYGQGRWHDIETLTLFAEGGPENCYGTQE